MKSSVTNHFPLVGVSSDSVRTESEAIRVGGEAKHHPPTRKTTSLRLPFFDLPTRGR